jgi:hypothetical protein
MGQGEGNGDVVADGEDVETGVVEEPLPAVGYGADALVGADEFQIVGDVPDALETVDALGGGLPSVEHQIFAVDRTEVLDQVVDLVLGVLPAPAELA